MHSFTATIDIIGINPFVFVPPEILHDIFRQAGKDKGTIPIRGTVNGIEYTQTLLKYSGEWRLYINNQMLTNSPKRIGESIEITITFDTESREISPPVEFLDALEENKNAKIVFEGLPNSRRKEIVRYLANLKTKESLAINITRAIQFLEGKARFVGRDKP